jgi:tryptophanyl-tRNA synthetase
MMRELDPIRARAEELRANPTRVREILAAGAERCRTIASETIREAKERMGLI